MLADSFIDCDLRAQADKSKAHQAAGLIFSEGEQRGDLLPHNGIQQIEQALPFFFRGQLDDIRGVIGGSRRIQIRRSPSGSESRSSYRSRASKLR
jgi:hypothetical protein